MLLFYQTNCTIQIAVREDDEWRLAAQFQRGFLQVGIGASSHHDFARLRATGKSEFADDRVLSKRLPDNTSCL